MGKEHGVSVSNVRAVGEGQGQQGPRGQSQPGRCSSTSEERILQTHLRESQQLRNPLLQPHAAAAP